MMFNPDCIHAYLTPDPLNDDNAIEDESLSWLHGFLNEPDEEQGLPAILRDENIDLYSRIEEDAKSRLARAIETSSAYFCHSKQSQDTTIRILHRLREDTYSF
jgi:regulator of sirC expression with transglutaminase-like and TPR domain